MAALPAGAAFQRGFQFPQRRVARMASSGRLARALHLMQASARQRCDGQGIESLYRWTFIVVQQLFGCLPLLDAEVA
jgi:hypothetical protein